MGKTSGAKKQKRTSGGIFPDYRTKGWNQAKWTRLVILIFILAIWLLLCMVASDLAKSMSRDARLFLYGTAIFIGAISVLFVRGLIWRAVIRPKLGVAFPTTEKAVSSQRHKRSLMTLSPTEFEQEIAFVFEQLWPVRAEVVGGAGDEGIDLMLYERETGKLHAIVQAKRYSPNKVINPTYIRELAFNRQRLDVEHAYLITTARFGNGATEIAAKERIKLITGQQFEAMRRKVYANFPEAKMTQ